MNNLVLNPPLSTPIPKSQFSFSGPPPDLQDIIDEGQEPNINNSFATYHQSQQQQQQSQNQPEFEQFGFMLNNNKADIISPYESFLEMQQGLQRSEASGFAKSISDPFNRFDSTMPDYQMMNYSPPTNIRPDYPFMMTSM
jgi:hypothetical protein